MNNKYEIDPKFWIEFRELSINMQLNVLWWSLFNKKRVEKFVKEWSYGKSIKFAYRDSKIKNNERIKNS